MVESVDSVDGDTAPLRALHAVCRARGALLVVDEAHGLGVRGPGGRGLLAEVGLAGADDVVATVTLSKALGAQGGAVLGPEAVTAHLVDTARSFIFDTGLAPPSVGAALAALHVLEAEPGRPARGASPRGRPREAAGAAAPRSAIVPVVLGEPEVAVAAARACLARGVRVGCFRPPSVPEGTSRLRLTARAGPDRGRPRAGARGAGGGPRARGRLLIDARAAAGPSVQPPATVTAIAAGSSWSPAPGRGSGRLSSPPRSPPCTRTGSRCSSRCRPGSRRGSRATSPTSSGSRSPTPSANSPATRTRSPRPRPPAAPAVQRSTPASPRQAARLLAATHDLVLVEGAGGLLVRFTADGAPWPTSPANSTHRCSSSPRPDWAP